MINRLWPLRFHRIPTYAEAAQLIAGGGRVLDIGCSEGFFLSELTAPMRAGLEREMERVRQGRRAYPDLHLLCADAGALPFTAGVFDRITLIGVLPYVADPAEVIRQAAACLAPGGRLMISAAADYALYRWLNLPGRRQSVRYFTREEIIAWVEAAGLRVRHAAQKGRLWAPLLAVLYSAPSFFDRRVLRAASIIGPAGRLARALTNFLVQWDYDHCAGPGYQIFIAGDKPSA